MDLGAGGLIVGRDGERATQFRDRRIERSLLHEDAREAVGGPRIAFESSIWHDGASRDSCRGRRHAYWTEAEKTGFRAAWVALPKVPRAPERPLNADHDSRKARCGHACSCSTPCDIFEANLESSPGGLD
jgi:hypothetical protein